MSTLQRYLVAISETTTHKRWIAADSSEQARLAAVQLFNDFGSNGFAAEANGIDDIEVLASDTASQHEVQP